MSYGATSSTPAEAHVAPVATDTRQKAEAHPVLRAPRHIADDDRYPPWAKRAGIFMGSMLVGTAAAVAMSTARQPGSVYDQLSSSTRPTIDAGGPAGHTADLPMGIPDVSKGVATDDWRTTASPTGAPSPKTMTTRGPYVPVGHDDVIEESISVSPCLVDDTARVYKYTIASSDPEADAKWAVDLLGVTNANLTYECGVAGKTTAFMNTALMTNETTGEMTKIDGINFDHHFVKNEHTQYGDEGLIKWDQVMKDANTYSYKFDTYNAFMDYSLVYYLPDASKFVRKLLDDELPFLVRSQHSGLDDENWYSFITSTPSGKTVELVTTSFEAELLDHFDVQTFSDKGECGAAHLSVTYPKHWLNYWYNATHGELFSQLNGGYPVALPIRANVAVPPSKNLTEVVDWYKANIPAVGRDFQVDAVGGCEMATTTLGQSSFPNLKFEIRLISNPDAYSSQQASIEDFVSYMERVNDEYTSMNGGWSGWWDRHLGIYFEGCSLDDYMKVFNQSGTTFHPHARNNDGGTNKDGQPTDHVWTGGASGFGMEMLGALDYSYADCYYTFDWCTWDTDPTAMDKAKAAYRVCASDDDGAR